jgi:hypothetical protein
MRASDDWASFMRILNRALPQQPQSADDRRQKKLEFSA